MLNFKAYMKLVGKLILLIILLTTSAHIFGQKPITVPKTIPVTMPTTAPIPTPAPKGVSDADKKAYKEAKDREEAQKKEEAKRREEIKKMLEQQSKSESSTSKMSQTAEAAVLAKAEAFYSAAMSQINSKHVTWVKQNAKKIFVEKMDDLAFKVMARYYGKNEGLSEEAIEGLQVLLLREAYMLEKKAYSVHNKEAQAFNDKKTDLMIAREMLGDSSYQVSDVQLDSINIIIKNNTLTVTESAKEEKQTAPTQSRKMPEKKEEINAASNFSLTKVKLEESINGLAEAQNHQEQQMQEIKRRQQKITLMLSKMVNQVTEHQESIIKNLK